MARIKTVEPEEAREKIAMSVQTDNQVKLSDGRSVGYAEYGDPWASQSRTFTAFPVHALKGIVRQWTKLPLDSMPA